MIHTMTGNALDIVHEYENGKPVFKGLVPRFGNGEVEGIITLPDPRGFIEVLDKVLKECGR